VDRLLVLGDRGPQRLQQPPQEPVLEACALGDLRGGVALLPLLEDPLDRQQDEPVLLHRPLELVEGHAGLSQLLEQGKPGLPRVGGAPSH
jgi:hypothetical protein